MHAARSKIYICGQVYQILAELGLKHAITKQVAFHLCAKSRYEPAQMHDFEQNNNHSFLVFTMQNTALQASVKPSDWCIQLSTLVLPPTLWSNQSSFHAAAVYISGSSWGPLTKKPTHLPTCGKGELTRVYSGDGRRTLQNSHQLGGFTCPLPEKWEGVTGFSNQNKLASAYISRLNPQLLFKRVLHLGEKDVHAQQLH